MVGVIVILLNLYALAVLTRSVFSFFQVTEGSVAAKIYDGVYAITEPVLAPIRSVIGPVDFGSMAMDLSPIILLIGIVVITRLLGG